MLGNVLNRHDTVFVLVSYVPSKEGVWSWCLGLDDSIAGLMNGCENKLHMSLSGGLIEGPVSAVLTHPQGWRCVILC